MGNQKMWKVSLKEKIWRVKGKRHSQSSRNKYLRLGTLVESSVFAVADVF